MPFSKNEDLRDGIAHGVPLVEARSSLVSSRVEAGRTLAKQLLEHYPAVIWEDQDECLEVRPEDIPV